MFIGVDDDLIFHMMVSVILCSYEAWQLAQNIPAPFDFLEKYIEEQISTTLSSKSLVALQIR
jgi:hypothetical protein